jgi:hypothetical protein
MPTVERRRFRFHRQEEDADEGAVMIAHHERASGETQAGSLLTGEAQPWACDPCGSTNTVDRQNCAYCGRVR